MRVKMAVLTKPFDAEGEIRPSWAFTDRYRLVDPATDQTIAYLKTSRVGPPVKEYLGRYVGVHAARKRLEKQIFVIEPAELTVIGSPAPTPPPTTQLAKEPRLSRRDRCGATPGAVHCSADRKPASLRCRASVSDLVIVRPTRPIRWRDRLTDMTNIRPCPANWPRQAR